MRRCPRGRIAVGVPGNHPLPALTPVNLGAAILRRVGIARRPRLVQVPGKPLNFQGRPPSDPVAGMRCLFTGRLVEKLETLVPGITIG